MLYGAKKDVDFGTIIGLYFVYLILSHYSNLVTVTISRYVLTTSQLKRFPPSTETNHLLSHNPTNLKNDKLVRPTFLGFPHLTDWDKSYMASFAPLLSSSPQNPSKTNPPIPDPEKITGEKLAPNDRIHGTFWGEEASLTVLENSRTARAGRYVDAEEDVGGKKMKETRFMQSEEASGFMGGVLVVDGWMVGNLKKKFVKFNEDFVGECLRKFELRGRSESVRCRS
ncbi:hypothetical protein BDZ45DRAFT_738782 [Acephala macrosclerotiorum]|nr:hypothetical protein BDZ45DRAFT_738782 [Acephala macrosclerotiorum]